MKPALAKLLLVLPLLAAAPLRADDPSSADYRSRAGALGSGGIALSGGPYSGSAVLGAASGEGDSAAYAEKSGTLSQEARPVTVTVGAAANPLAERASTLLSATVLLDDATLLVPAAPDLAWAASLAGAGIDAGGLLTAPSLYRDASVEVTATYDGLDSAPLSILVLNTGSDDFGLYAADGLDDLWQVGFFGEENPDGTATGDPDGDGLDNAAEEIHRLDPTDSSSRLELSFERAPDGSVVALRFAPFWSDRTYGLLRGPDLGAENTAPLATATLEPAVSEGGTATLRDPAPPAIRAFYRLSARKP